MFKTLKSCEATLVVMYQKSISEKLYKGWIEGELQDPYRKINYFGKIHRPEKDPRKKAKWLLEEIESRIMSVHKQGRIVIVQIIRRARYE